MKTARLTKKERRSGRLGRFARAGEAVSALEYAILVGIIAVAIAGVLVTFSGNISTAINTIGGEISGLTGAGTPSLTDGT